MIKQTTPSVLKHKLTSHFKSKYFAFIYQIDYFWKQKEEHIGFIANTRSLQHIKLIHKSTVQATYSKLKSIISISIPLYHENKNPINR